MDAYLRDLEQAFLDYRKELEAAQKKQKPTDGLLGFGSSLKDDPCHERMDERVALIITEMCLFRPAQQTAEQAARMLLLRDDLPSWPLSAQWMLRAIERHCVPLIPFLSPEAAGTLLKEYTARNKPWDRLPTQRQTVKLLKARRDS